MPLFPRGSCLSSLFKVPPAPDTLPLLENDRGYNSQTIGAPDDKDHADPDRRSEDKADIDVVGIRQTKENCDDGSQDYYDEALHDRLDTVN